MIVYISNLMDKSVYEYLYTKTEKPGIQVQIFNRLIVDGLMKNGVVVKCLSAVPVSDEIMDRHNVKIENDNLYYYFPVTFTPIVKDLKIAMISFYKAYSLIKKSDNSCIIDVLSVSNGLGAVIACKLLKKKCMGIVTDLPQFMTSNKLYSWICNSIIKNCSSYLFLTKEMNDVLNKKKKEYIVIEGFGKDVIMPQISRYARKNIIIYAGNLNKDNGIETLLDSFKSIDTDMELHIYGSGDYVSDLKIKIMNIANIKFFGLVNNDTLFDELRRAKYLVNPRPSIKEFTKYSFPSKIIEYLSTGTPFITTNLSGITSDYYPFLNFFEREDIEGIKNGLIDLFSQEYERVLEKAQRAQEYIANNKNNIVQTKKIVEMLNIKVG